MDRDADRRFEKLARALDSAPRPKKKRIVSSLDEGFDSLGMDPYFERDDEEDYDTDNRMYVMDYGRPGRGVSRDRREVFRASFADLGNGQADTTYAIGKGAVSYARNSVATCREKGWLRIGVAGEYASTPNSSRFDSTTNEIDIRAKVAMDLWSTTAANRTIVSKEEDPQRTCWLGHNSSGQLFFFWTPTGAGAEATFATSSAHGLTDGQVKWVRVTFRGNNGAGVYEVKFWLSDDNITWNLLSTTTGTIGSRLFSGTASAKIGARGTGSTEVGPGKFYRMEWRNRIDGPIAAMFDAFDATASGASTVTSSLTGEVWTINNTALVFKTGLKKVAANVARSHYALAGTYRGLFIEGARTNLCLRSEALDDAAWTKTDTTVTADSIAGPDGTVTADLTTDGSAGTAVVSQAYTATADVPYSFSFFARRGNNDWVATRMSATGASADFWWNLNTGVVGSSVVGGTGSAAAIAIEDWGNGWYRCKATATMGGGQTAITTQVFNTSADAVTTRVNGATRYSWGFQFENNSAFASSYVPTAGASVQRVADALTYIASGVLAAPLTVTCEVTWHNPTNGQRALAVSDGSSNNRLFDLLANSATLAWLFGSTATVQQFSITKGTIAADTPEKIALVVDTNRANIFVDGAAGTVDNTVDPTVAATQFEIGALVGANNLFGTIKDVVCFGRAVPDTEALQLIA